MIFSGQTFYEAQSQNCETKMPHTRPARKTGGGSGEVNNGFTTALNLTFSPQEKEQLLHDSGFADDRPANPIAGFFKVTAENSPSPWGEGRDEGER